MIRLEVELEDLTNEYETKTVILPCNLRSELDMQHEYLIFDCTPHLTFGDCTIQKLNDVLDEINCENPGMTAEYLEMLLNASLSGDIFDEEFLRRIKENDFLFEDLSDLDWRMGEEETAARYLATVQKLPFDSGVTEDLLEALGNEAVAQYINWADIWSQYQLIGFTISEDLESEEYGLYLIHWRK